MYLLDYGIIVAYLKDDSHAIKFIDENLGNCHIPAIVVVELYGTNSSQSRIDSIARLRESFPIVKFGEAEATAYGEIKRKLNQKGAAASVVEEMIAATALSLNATIVTHRSRQFNIISPELNLKNWRTSDDWILSPHENKPGILYQVAELMKELNINIIEAYGGNNNVSQTAKSHSLIVDVPNRNIFEQLQLRLINVTYEPNTYEDRQSTQIKFDYIPTSPQFPNKKFIAEGRDRVGLLADVSKLIAERNVNIIASGCQIGENSENFYIFFCLYGELNEPEWQALLEEIRKVKDDDDNDIDADLNDI